MYGRKGMLICTRQTCWTSITPSSSAPYRLTAHRCLSSSSKPAKQLVKPSTYQQKSRNPAKAPLKPPPPQKPSSNLHSKPAPKTLVEQFSSTPKSLPTTPQPAVPPPVIDLVNPPISTHPPPLNLPEWDDSLPRWKAYYHLGRAYLRFYKLGLKQIRRNWKAAKLYRISRWSNRRQVEAAVKRGDLTRAEYHLLLRVKADVVRLPFFAVFLALSGEFTPILVPFLTGVIPPRVWLPKQVEKRRRKQMQRVPEERREEGLPSWELMGEKVAYVPLSSWATATRMDVFVAGTRIRAWPRFWDRFARWILPLGLLKRRVERGADTLKLDDYAIERDGGVRGLNDIELAPAVFARGIDTEYRATSDLRIILEHCVQENQKAWSPEMKSWLRLDRIGKEIGGQIK